MARIETYREAIEAVIRDYASVKPAFGDIDMEAVTDRTHDHYEVMMMGWDNHERVHTSLIHIDIINNKVWIHTMPLMSGLLTNWWNGGSPRKILYWPFTRCISGPIRALR